jgi:putative ATP-dependent endonuclease of OLD family
MKLVRLRLSNFRSFGPTPTEIALDEMIFLLGPNGAGKTSVLVALARMFCLDPAQRKVRKTDFHVPNDEAADAAPDTRTLWIEAEFEFPDLEDDGADPAIPGNFAHMQLVEAAGPLRMRFRLTATIDDEDEIDETFVNVIRQDADGEPAETSRVGKHDRNSIQVHYLPARRDPSDHISYSTTALLGRALRAANWSAERATVSTLTGQINDALTGNDAMQGIAEALAGQWEELHTGSYFSNPSVSFSRNELESLLRHLSLHFAPGHDEPAVDFSRLSDGQQSILYISLVLAMHDLGARVLAGELDGAFDVDKLRPAVFTLIAVEEPENSLSPHYLGRVVRALTEFAEEIDAQALVATHSPALMRRVAPESVRYLRLGADRTTIVRSIRLPGDDDAEAQKFVREAVQAFPELYFARLVILGEGDSEEIVLPRLMKSREILADDASISVVPLGGRHVNHFWRLLRGLGIPHVTLLDLDLARHQGGWGRIKYAAKQLRAYSTAARTEITVSEIDAIPAWDSTDGLMVDDFGWIDRLEAYGVFFSSPLDLDFMMMSAFEDAYEVGATEKEDPDEAGLKAVLGKSHDPVLGGQYTDDELRLFGAYHSRFKLASKPVSHIRAMARLEDVDIAFGLPSFLDRMLDLVTTKLDELPE